MARTYTGPELATILSAGVSHHLYVYVADADGTLQDCSDLGTLHLDLLDGTSWGETLDTAVSTGVLTIRRDTTDDSAAPTMGASSINRNALGAYAPLFEKGREIRIATAVVPQGSFPTEADKRTMLIGRIDGVHWHDNPMTIDISDLGAWLADAQLRVTKQYASNSTVPGEGPLLGAIIQSMINDAMPGSGVTLYEPVTAPFQPFADTPQEPGSLLAAARNWAQEIGWDLRYRWTVADVFALTLFEPPRTNVTPDWTFGPSQYRKVSNLSSNIADIRNDIVVQYKDASGALQTAESTDPVSIAKYGGPGAVPRVWIIPSTAIRNATDAMTLATAVDSDLSEPDADQEIEMPFFPLIQIGDVCLFQANGDHYDSDQTLAVVGYQHRFEKGEGSTTIQARGKVAGAYRAWINRPAVVPILPTDTRSLALKNFREKRRTPTVVTFGWDAVTSDVDAIWGWTKNVPQDADPPDASGDDRLWVDVRSTAPTVMLPNTATEFDVLVPVFGRIQTWEFIPVDVNLALGFSQRVKVLSTPDVPRITDLQTSIGATGLFAQILALNVVDPQALGGTLKAWLNVAGTNDANPNGAPDGTLAIAVTPRTVTNTDAFTVGGGTQQLFDTVSVHQGAGKRIYFEFVNVNGVSSGVITFTLLSNGGVIDPTGQLKDASINRAQQVASTMTLPSVYDALPPTGRANELAFLTTDKKFYRWDGAHWTVAVPTADLTGVITGPQIANNVIDLTKVASSLAPPQVFVGTLGASTGANQTALFNGELYRSDGAGGWTKAVNTTDLAGQVQTAQMAAGAVTTAILAANAVQTANLALGAVTNAILAANAVQTANLAVGSVTSAIIAANAVLTANLGAGAVTNAILAANAVQTANIALNAITTPLIAAGAVNTTTIADGAISTPKLIAGAVTANELAANSVTSVKITAGAVVTANLAAGAVTANELAANSVTTVKIVSGAVVTASLAAGAVTANELSANSVTTGKIVAGAVVTASLAAGAVTANELAANSVTTTKIVAGAVVTASIAAGAIVTSSITAGAVTANEIAALTITASNIAAGAIVAGKIAGNAVTAGTIAANAVTAGTIVAGAVSTTELAANAVTAAKIGAGEVQTVHMTAGTINGDRIATNTLNADRIIANTITATQILANSLTAATLAANAVTATAIAAGSISTGHIATIVLAETAPNAGIIQIGKLRSVDGLRYLDLNASGTNPFLHHPLLNLNADGSASFAGTLSGATGTFSGSLSAASGSFTGTLSGASGTFVGALSGATGTFAGSLTATSVVMSGVDPTNGTHVTITTATLSTGAKISFYNTITGYESQIYSDGYYFTIQATAGIIFQGTIAQLQSTAGNVFLVSSNQVIVSGSNAAPFQVTKADGTVLFSVDEPTVNNNFGISIRYRDDTGAYRLARLLGDNTNTGGAGNRNARIAN